MPPDRRPVVALIAYALVATAAPQPVLAAAVGMPGEIDFNRDVRPVLSDNCYFCHGPDEHERKAGLRLDNYDGATEDRDGVRAIDPGNLAGSEFLRRLTATDAGDLMPPPKSHKQLSQEQIDLLRRWVEAGAQFDDHWAFVAPGPPAAPHPDGAPAGWDHSPIDRLVLTELKARGLAPAPEAGRTTLIRRVTFDLTGLPPTVEEVDAFLADGRPGAFGRVVDRLLASPAFGERMAVAWMDIARFGDSSVMHADGPRDMWAWRDWVIDAYNSNKPFDAFSIEQLAGDLIPDADTQSLIATGFNRNHATSDEGGAFPEELRVEYVADRVQTTANTWMAISMECSQCHDHKYDPVSQREYYQMFAYFNNTTDPGMQTRNGNQTPVVKFFASEEEEARFAALTAELELQRKNLADRRSAAGPGFRSWLAGVGSGGAVLLPEPAGLAHRFEPGEPDPVTSRTPEFAGGAPATTGFAGGPAFEFAGDRTGEVDPEHAAAFDRGDAYTIAAWVRPPANGQGSGAVVARMDVGAAHRGFDLWLQGNRVGTHLVHSWPDDALKVVGEKPLEPGKWQHVAVAYDGSGEAAGVRVYIDGVAGKTTVEKDQLEGTTLTDTPLTLGRRSSGSTFNGAAGDIRIYRRALQQDEVARIGQNPIGSILAIAPDDRTDEERETLFDYYLTTEDGTFQQLAADESRLSDEVAELEKNRASSMVMEDRDELRPTYILDRGAYDSPRKDEVIPPGTPAFLPPQPEGSPANRLGLARWLFQPDHPLTARVAVNRYWAMFFGTGLVKTVADFGAQGDVPSHPALLDWLATDFRDHGWDIKRTIRQIVTSATYRQDSAVRTATADPDPDPQNRLLARGPRFRLQGEFIRDNALAVSGLLNRKTGGPSVKPYQPDGLWNEVSLDRNLRFQQDTGNKLYRRSLYIYWKRSAPHPGMIAFDAPTREKCVIQRDRTNTPLQALVTLNDVQFVEAARHLAEDVLLAPLADDTARLAHAFRLATARTPDGDELDLLADALDAQRAHFTDAPDQADELLAAGESPRDSSLNPIEHAAWTNLASILLNLDETLTRG